ncbi:hypothetical protein SAMN04488030_2680 [Aliiroseovarius halocynthiae]|uniref:Uncharacterized protein n=1 Tax=Aliiroseovarius halocynthiae TaxID=985055 RepID=A0A545SPB8_9RHOB|nr:hypothetical protein [Aliiroseovarius halocynthiae]TQV66832.1 hypothetical protein FIL88_12110 [Aliiroseovarius halocynthiae]SMR82331.1 hypothetical protein SAMN04488030_2680 [Aliiroseovarius halocynthiae]
MNQADIIDRLEQIAEGAIARRGRSIALKQDTADARRHAAVAGLQATILPRFVRFSNAQNDSATLSVNNGRVAEITDVTINGTIENLADATALQIAEVLMKVCTREGVELDSSAPNDADDIATKGIYASDIKAAFEEISVDAPAEEQAPVQETATPEEPPTVAPPPPPEPEESPAEPEKAAGKSVSGLAADFFASVTKIGDQRVLVAHDDKSVAGPDGILTQNIDVVQQLMDDLSAWEDDSDHGGTAPQLVIMRSQSQDMPSLTICRDSDATAMTAHPTRKLGSVVQLWKTLTTQQKSS